MSRKISWSPKTTFAAVASDIFDSTSSWLFPALGSILGNLISAEMHGEN
jgi:hypothetical protein